MQIPRGLDQERVEEIDRAVLASDDFTATRALGDRWYAGGRTAVLWVPSAVSPYESNVLFNQGHADFARLEVHPPEPAHVDPRLTRP